MNIDNFFISNKVLRSQQYGGKEDNASENKSKKRKLDESVKVTPLSKRSKSLSAMPQSTRTKSPSATSKSARTKSPSAMPQSTRTKTPSATPESTRTKSFSAKLNSNSALKNTPRTKLKKLHIRMNFKSKSKREDSSDERSDVTDKSREVAQSLSDTSITDAVNESTVSNASQRSSCGEGDSKQKRLSISNGDSATKNENKPDGEEPEELSRSEDEALEDEDYTPATVGVHRNPQFLKHSSSTTLKRSKSEAQRRESLIRKRRSTEGDAAEDGGERSGPVHLRDDASSWTPPQSPLFLIEEQLYKDPWRVLVASLFTEPTSGELSFMTLYIYIP